MKKISHIILGGAALLALPLNAQVRQAQDSTVNRTVVVEQQYNPDIMDAQKINVLPQVEPPTVSKKEVEYATTLSPAGTVPGTPMQAYTAQEKPQKRERGYARLGYGNYGNLDAKASYLFHLSEQDRIGIDFSLDGMNGKLDYGEEKWNSYFYRTRAAMNYVHAFQKAELDVAGRFGLSNFNNLPGYEGGKQKFTSGELHLGAKSTTNDQPLRFRAETNLMLYQRQNDLLWKNAQEVLVRTRGEAAGDISEGQSVGICLDMDNRFYKNNDFKSQTTVDLNPYYRYSNDEWDIRLGAHVDLAFGFGKGFRAAPDLTAQYNFSESYLLYARATGGRRANDFRRLEALYPYGQLNSQADATYEQLNAAVGFKTSPVNGLWFNLYGGYQNLKNDLSQVLTLHNAATGSYIPYFCEEDTYNAYAGAEISYDYKSLFQFSLSGIYRSWDVKEGEWLLLFKPELEADFHVELHPLSPLLLQLGYQHISYKEVAGEKPDAVGNLYLGGSYEFVRNISIYARVNNILNKDYQYYWGCPAEGFNFVGGVCFRF